MEKANVIEELRVSFSYGQDEELYVSDGEEYVASMYSFEGTDFVATDDDCSICTVDLMVRAARAFNEFKKLIEKHDIREMSLEFDEGVGDVKISFETGGVTNHISSIPESLLDAQRIYPGISFEIVCILWNLKYTEFVYSNEKPNV